MSTRCQIGFYRNVKEPVKDFTALLYRHSDGYPSGVLPEIIPFLKEWRTRRGLSDAEYTAARLLQYLCNEYDKGSTTPGTLGYGICKQFHGDIEYFYRVYPNAVAVYAINWNINWKIQNERDINKRLFLLKTFELETETEDPFHFGELCEEVSDKELNKTPWV